MGKAITDKAERISAPMLIGLLPTRSISQPPTGEIKSAGIEEIATTSPAFNGESNKDKTSQGIVIIISELPNPEVRLDNCNK